MYWIVTKYLITAAVIVAVSEIAKRSDKLGALTAALPMVTILALIWMYIEGQSTEKLDNHAWYTFWYVVPTLPMFLAFPYLHARFSFWVTLGICALISVICFWGFSAFAKLFGVNLL
ncbi:DUF3147 family protein [Parashewanella curva]|uniref:DUF3147 family protein n=1 Tax=Parashewanella curva TaxID=2338552 RepID=A0A3L8PZV5_9GAMM|nr:DUF3147 family protein [Parashewanella curva]RLV59632.1 DUF3147 family protein [Parashewanella curva]